MKKRWAVSFFAGTLLLATFLFFDIPATADLWERHISGAYEVPQFDGSGEIVAIYDSGCAWNHVDFGDTGKTANEVNKALLKRGIHGGKLLTTEYPQLGESALYCVTEVHSKEDIDRLASNLQEVVT